MGVITCDWRGNEPSDVCNLVRRRGKGMKALGWGFSRSMGAQWRFKNHNRYIVNSLMKFKISGSNEHKILFYASVRRFDRLIGETSSDVSVAFVQSGFKASEQGRRLFSRLFFNHECFDDVADFHIVKALETHTAFIAFIHRADIVFEPSK